MTMPAPANETPDAQDESAAPALREARRSAQRQGVTRAIFASYCVDAALLAALWLAGAVRVEAVLICAIGGASTSAFFYTIFKLRLNQRSRDPYLAVQQLTLATALQLLIAARAPEIGLLALSVLFIILAFAALRLSAREVLLTWLGVSAGVLFVLMAIPRAASAPHADALQSLLSAVWISLVLARCALVGLYGSRVRQQLARRTRELALATGRLEHLATRDELTGTLNRRAILEALSSALAPTPGADGGAAVLLADLDRFKSINDQYGHVLGDEVLRRFSLVAARTLRGSDRMGRYGGEEFLLVLDSLAGADAAVTIAERLRDAVARDRWDDLAPGLSVTVSVGVACASPGDAPMALVERADRALYRAKRAGRDRVELALADEAD